MLYIASFMIHAKNTVLTPKAQKKENKKKKQTKTF